MSIIAVSKNGRSYRRASLLGTSAPVPRIADGDARGLFRDHAGRARSNGGRHGAADYRRRTQRLRPVRVGRHVLLAHLRDHRAYFRPARRLLRPQTVRDRVHRGLHRRVRALRLGEQYAVSRARARTSRHWRRDAGRHRVCLHCRSVPGFSRAPSMASHDEFRIRYCECGWPVAGRDPDAILRLALRVLREFAGRLVVGVFRVAFPPAPSTRRSTKARCDWTGKARA